MEIEFDDDTLDKLYTEGSFTGGFSAQIVKQFRFVMQLIVSATDERDLYQFKSRRFEKLDGKRKHQHSLRLNKQWRLIVEIRGKVPNKSIAIVEITDYH